MVITYRELRLLELAILRQLYKSGQLAMELSLILKVDVDQFYGIEIEEWPARIAEVALWLMDHQMNQLLSEEFGQYFARLPLAHGAKIVQANALRLNWEEVVPKSELSYILGNPPFYGYSYQTKQQKEELRRIFHGVDGAGVLDYVTGWYLLAAKYVNKTNIKVAFVSTNSISQGEQVGILWNELINKYSITIHFAHRTFRWDNEARSKAAVHVIIIGFGFIDVNEKAIYDYTDIKGEPHEVKVKTINPYLVESSIVLILKRANPICLVPQMIKGSSPTDGGYLLLENDEKDELIKREPLLEKYIKRYVGSREYINSILRWCLRLKNASPQEIKRFPDIIKRVESVKKMRLESEKEATRRWADYPSLFVEDRQPNSDYLLIPRVSSENRKYIPIGFLSKEVIVSDSAITIPIATLLTFGIITSAMHMTWVRYTCGRLKSDYRYSNTLVYNNYPWPDNPGDKAVKPVEEKAQQVLDARLEFPDSSLADLYDPLTMPPKLVKAHQELDKAVDLCYRPQPFSDEAGRIEYLFELYHRYTAGLFREEKKKKR